MNKKKTPFFVTILGSIALILTVFNAIRFGTALSQWDLILAFASSPGPLYIALTGLIWALGWLIAYLGIEFAWKWGGVVFLLLSFLYASYYWLDRLFFQLPAQRSNVIFAFIVTFLFLVSTVIILAFPKSRAYFNGKGITNEENRDIY